jgi:hypothetical protein
LTPERARALMPLALYSLLALVQEFLPAMLERREGAILSAQGASAVRGMPHIAGGFALAAQRNYLQLRPAPACRTCPKLTRTISPAFSGPCTARKASRKPPTPRAFPATEQPGE